MDNKKRVDHRLTTPTPNKLHRLNNRLSIMFVFARVFISPLRSFFSASKARFFRFMFCMSARKSIPLHLIVTIVFVSRSLAKSLIES
jgi:hypothetical protein